MRLEPPPTVGVAVPDWERVALNAVYVLVLGKSEEERLRVRLTSVIALDVHHWESFPHTSYVAPPFMGTTGLASMRQAMAGKFRQSKEEQRYE